MGRVTFLQLWASLVLLCGVCRAGPLGKNFVTAFMQNYKLTYSQANFQVFITGYSPSTTVTVWLNKSSFKKVLNVDERSTISVQIPPSAELPGESKTCNVVVIQADKDISVLSLNYKLQSADVSLVFPVQDLGTEYYAVTPLGGPDDGFKEFSVISTEEPTNVDIFLTGTVRYQGSVYRAGSKLTVLLEAYNVLQLLSQDDLSGSRIVSQKPVAVLSGHTCTWQNTKCNHVYEQLLPVSSWGTTFFVPPVSLQTRPDIVFVVASQATKIDYQVNAKTNSQNLNAGQVLKLDIPVRTPIFIQASAGIQVTYYLTGWQDRFFTQFDPLLMNIPPMNSYCSSYYIYGHQEFENYGTLLVRSADISKVTINKNPAGDLSWNDIPGTEYSWSTTRLTKGFSFQLVENPSPFLLLSYGLTKLNSYGTAATCINAVPVPSCSTVKCRAKEKCTMENGKPKCVPEFEAYCHAVGDPHYRTFDGRFYDFQGTCTYTIAKNCGSDSGLTAFNIEAKNENRGSTRVSYISYVTVEVYDFTISLVRYEYGFVRVNNQRQRLPINLNNGQVRLYHSGAFVIIETDFTLKVYYDWNSILKVYLSSSYFGSVCGMCGNFNGNAGDDLVTPGGTQAPNLVDFGKSWKVEDGDRFCWHNCNGECKTCPLETQKKYEAEGNCGLISKADGPFRQCHAVVNPKTYLDDCVYDLCMNGGSKQILCQSIKTYAEACQRNNVQIGEWRQPSGCPMQCPDNSQYKLCGRSCPKTCNDEATPKICSNTCVETCECKDGFVLDEGKCVPEAKCGCIYQGKLYAANEKFWGDNKCEQQCVCNPSTRKVECKATRCKSSERCAVVNGIQNCYPLTYGTCSASGDPHYVTFDGVRYDFQGTCIYQFAGVCKKSEDLIDFQVNVQNENRGSKVVSYTSAVQVKVCDFDIVIDRRYKDRILLNGILTNLPYVVDNGKLSIYKQGFHAIVQTSFGLRVTFNWESYISVTVPSTYAGALCGLCGNFDGKTDNEFTMKNNQVTTKPVIFGNSWKVQNVPGCYEEDKGDCTKLAELELRHINNKEGCGIIVDKSGPFRECHAKVDPQGHFKSCVYDACFYEGRPDVLCKIIASYATACQQAGATVYPWRSAKFCSPVCGKNSHYDVCATGCAPTCLTLAPPLGCNPVCSEGCVCDDGFILSGGDCVPLAQCGCNYKDKYYKSGEIFYPSGLCSQQCVCTPSGAVECKAFSCGPNEECKVVDGVQKCQPVGSAQCSAAGDPHYLSFDGLAFDFQGTCTYTLSKTVTSNLNLEPFEISVENEKYGNGQVSVTKLVALEAYGYNLVLQYNNRGRILVNRVLHNLPLILEDGKIRAYQHGLRVNIDTDFGVKVSYDLVYHVIVTVPGNYKGQLGGLCGNYNGDRKDEFQLPDKKLAPDATTFGAAWKVKIPGVSCNDGCGGPGNPCPSCDDRRKEIFKTENYCGFLKKSGGPLSACYAVVNPDPYFNSCIFDVCASEGNAAILCQSIQSYVAACHAAGVTIQPWRTEAFCPLKCPANSQYKVCADVCSTGCAGITDPDKCPTSCSEGCECDDGFFFDGQGCVSMDKCGCFENGKYYQPNEEVLSDDCKEVCQCTPAGGLVCQQTGCAADERCQIKDGIVKCINIDPCKSVKCRTKETCKVQNGNAVCVPDYTGTCWAWGDPHYHTFDGYNYDFQGTCTYILSKYIGNDAGLVPFTVEEKNDNRGNQVVSYVRTVSIYVYGYKVSILKGESGRVRVNDVITNLPVTLLDGKISISMSGPNAVVHTDFGLQVTYEYNWHVVITLTSSYYGAVGGLCGNFNQNVKDEWIGVDNKPVASIIDWAKSWKVNDRDPFCFDVCHGVCPTCDESKKNLYGSNEFCGLISKAVDGPFRECHAKVNPDTFFDSCIYDVCINGGAKQFLCQALDAYAKTCRKQGVKIYDWRTPSGCVLPCPANSHYEFCGNACPASCTDRTAPDRCTEDCVETCQCNNGFVLSADKCVSVSSCGCNYNGAYYQPNQEFWSDDNCRVLCKCDPTLGMVVCKETSCKSSEKCMVVDGVRGCHPFSFSTCSASGDPHYTTFDGQRYDFMGTCIYQFVGVTSKDPSLTQFTVKVENNNRGDKAVSYTKVVTVEVYGLTLTLNMDYPRRILIDGVTSALPFYYQANKVMVYISGYQGVIKTDFDMTVTYDWSSHVTVTLPSTYSNAVAGLCGNYNKNPKDDLTMKDGKVTTNVVQFGNSWKVGDAPGCTPECTGKCPQCTEAQKQEYKSEKYCGIITKPNGPLSQCLSVVDPTPYFSDCIFDACQYKGHPSSFCSAISRYVLACQGAGVKLQEWRSASFCPLTCHANSHYELCGDSCPVTCHGLSSPAGCEATCKEGCYCDNGYILSGHKCVPLSQCGCIYQEKYYQKNEVFFPKNQCNEKCQCLENGVVKCQAEACGPEEECKVVNGVRGCHPKGCGKCVAAGDPHYTSFDGLNFDFQGTCTYTFAKVVEDDPRLVKFSVVVENESYGDGRVAVTRLVVVSVYGYTIAIERGMKWKVRVDGEIYKLPLLLEDGDIAINQEGNNVVLQTDFGMKVLYDTVYYVMINIPSTYRGKVGGLCGNFNGDKNDEFQLPDKRVVKNVNEFGASWKVSIKGAKCSDGCGDQCPVCVPAKLEPYKKPTSCGMITNPAGPFKACHSKISPVEYFNNCIYDACAVDGKDDIVCKSLQAYAAVCHTAGVTIAAWRSPTFCPLSCPANSHYELCTNTCGNTCSGISSPTKCTDRCFEGCECDTGFVFDGDKCVPMEKCGCTFNGRYLSDGESFVSVDCSLQCKCQAGGVICKAVSCGAKEQCGVVNGVRGCYKAEGECQLSPQKFVTFDGLSGGPVGNGPFEVASLCNADSDSWFRIVADIQKCGTVSSVSRLHIFLRNAFVTVSKDKEAWFNGRSISLPAEVSDYLTASTREDAVLIQIGSSLKIELSNKGVLVLRASEGLSKALCGACGNFNGDETDDLLTPGGKQASNILQVIASWRAWDFYGCDA
ncbi:IgGFc-binding protein [Spea bombifrons]|uniref:IgGFc-binding protein n=1 Tax=Spea bombifrons TaxID=233779 RepID=UPI002348FE22|nr:IgGFc-binding protein [Spea bombifrons]